MIRQTVRYKNNKNHDKTFSKAFFESTISSSTTISTKKRKRENILFERTIRSKKKFSSKRKTQSKKNVSFKNHSKRNFLSFFIQLINSPEREKDLNEIKNKNANIKQNNRLIRQIQIPDERFEKMLIETNPNNFKKKTTKKTTISTKIKTNL